MQTKTVLAAVTTLLATSLFALGSAEAGNVTVYNKSSKCKLAFIIVTQNVSYAGVEVTPGDMKTLRQDSPCPTSVNVVWTSENPSACRMTGQAVHHQLATNSAPVCADIAFDITEYCHPIGICDPVITRIK